jgi:hypothetical protein
MATRRKSLSVIRTYAVALISLTLVHCAGTVTRSLNRQDPNALVSMMKDIKTQEVNILLRDGGRYPGKITRTSKDMVDIETPRAHSKIPTEKILTVSYKNHGLGATHGMSRGAGIWILSGETSDPDFFPAVLISGAIGGLAGLIIGAAQGATVTYEFRGNAGTPNPETQTLARKKPGNDILPDGMPQEERYKMLEPEAGFIDTTRIPDTVKTRQDDTTAKAVKGPAPPEDEYIMPDQLGRIKIILKDWSSIKSSVIREIHETWIVYEKDGILHDLAIGKILRVEFSRDGMDRTAVFDKNRLRVAPQQGVER